MARIEEQGPRQTIELVPAKDFWDVKGNAWSTLNIFILNLRAAGLLLVLYYRGNCTEQTERCCAISGFATSIIETHD